jgi:hypothetical protein
MVDALGLVKIVWVSVLLVSSLVCVDSASAALGLSHDGLSSHRAVLPVPLGAAVNKG